MMKKILSTFFATFVLLSYVGCNTDKSVHVSGKIVFDDQPGRNIAVLFQDVSGDFNASETAYGMTDEAGVYSLTRMNSGKKGVLPGNYAVRLSWKDPNANPNQIEGEASNVCPYKIPTRAKTGELRFTVPQGGTKSADFIFNSADESFAPPGV